MGHGISTKPPGEGDMVSEQTSATARDRQRPLSPHLQIYRPQITSVLSITHRATGVALAAGMLLLTCWLLAAATGNAAFSAVSAFLGSPLGLLMLFGWSVALFYHLANGIRHLFWDAGYGFDLPTVEKSGYFVLAFTVAATLLAWFAGLAVLGGR
jgi:succinate dehydrogenase / fumarate reductase cytochrome b subunit